jgi:hypothetical protein
MLSAISMATASRRRSNCLLGDGWIASLDIHNLFLRVVLGSGDKDGCQATKAGSGRLAVDW